MGSSTEGNTGPHAQNRQVDGFWKDLAAMQTQSGETDEHVLASALPGTENPASPYLQCHTAASGLSLVRSHAKLSVLQASLSNEATTPSGQKVSTNSCFFT